MKSSAELRRNGEFAQIACLWEATARKLGNVHPTADFADTTYTDFLLSAMVVGTVFRESTTTSVGERVLLATEKTQQLVGKNTNLGMILLLAPLTVCCGEGGLRSQLQEVLERLSVDDARLVYQAIRLASPAGLGKTNEQDVREEPTVSLREAMQLAADRDQIARQYVNGFTEVFDFGVPALQDGLRRFGTLEAAIIHCQLQWLARYPDSLIARKNGPATAEMVRERATEVQDRGGIATPQGRAAGIALDRLLRSDGNQLNPGTTADLITACLFVALRENMVTPRTLFRWNIEDWL